MTEIIEKPSSIFRSGNRDAVPAAHLALGRVLGALADGELEVRPHPGDPDPNGSSRISRRPAPPRAHRAADGPPGLAGERAAARTSGAAATNTCRCPGTRRSTCSAASCERVRDEHRPRRDLRRLLWLGQRGALPPRAEPDPPLPEHRAAAAMSSRSTATRRAPRSVAGAAHHRRLRGPDEAQRLLGADRRAHRDRARLRRHGAEEQHGGRRQHQPACRARRDGRARPSAAASSCWSARCASDLPEEAGAEWICASPAATPR